MFASALFLFSLTAISLSGIVPTVHARSSNCCKTEIVKPGEIPYQIILQNLLTRKYFCGGSLLNALYVLTAAQCTIGRIASDIIVHAGAVNLNDTHESTSSVTKIIIHEHYNFLDTSRNDIALLRLETYIFQSKYIDYSALPETQGVRNGNGYELARVSGFGIITEHQEPTFQKLRQYNTSLSPQEYCQYVYGLIQYNISETQICAYDPYNPFSQEKRISDMGGPLVVNGIVLGIASSSYMHFPKSVIFRPILFTNVSSYRDWIRASILDSDTY